MQREGKRLLWSPTPSSDRFVVYGGSDVRLHEWRPHGRPAKTAARSLAVLTDLPPFRALAWSPHTQSDDLVAIGLATGRTLLLRLQDPVSNQPASPTTVPYHSVSLSVKQQRPVNSLAFSPSDPNLLAVGLEKARDQAVHVWDIERSVSLLDQRFDDRTASGLDGRIDSPYRGGLRMSEGRQPTSPAPDVRPLSQIGNGEAVTSATFLYAGSNSSAQLVVGYGSKSIRIFDIRERSAVSSAGPAASAIMGPATATGIHQTRANTHICGDPFDGHRFASCDTEGIVKLWDTRRGSEAILTFSEADAGLVTVPAQSAALGVGSPSRRTNGVLGLAFSPLRRGTFATLETNATSVHIWDILQGAEAWGKDSYVHGDRESPEDPFVPAVLAASTYTAPFSRPPTSFSFAGISSIRSNAQALCSVSREGHLEFLEHVDPHRTAWTADGELAILAGHRLQTHDSADADRVHHDTGARAVAARAGPSSRPSFNRLSSVIGHEAPGMRTPRPPMRRKHTSLQSDDIRTVAERLEHLRDLELSEDQPNAIASDISNVMRARVHLGYAAEVCGILGFLVLVRTRRHTGLA
jgi:hypothetical protein